MGSLGAATGDQLCLTPDGKLAAKASLIRAAPAAAGDAGGRAGFGGQAELQPLDEGDYEEVAEQEAHEAEEAQQQRRGAAGQRHGATTNWHGLGAEDTDCCSLVLSHAAVRERSVSMPGELLRADVVGEKACLHLPSISYLHPAIVVLQQAQS